ELKDMMSPPSSPYSAAKPTHPPAASQCRGSRVVRRDTEVQFSPNLPHHCYSALLALEMAAGTSVSGDSPEQASAEGWMHLINNRGDAFDMPGPLYCVVYKCMPRLLVNVTLAAV